MHIQQIEPSARTAGKEMLDHIYLIIVGWQLIQKLLDSVFLSRTVNVRDLLPRQTSKVELHLNRDQKYS